MSISKVQELLQNKGCVWTVSILMVVGVVVSSFAQCGRADRFSQASNVVSGSAEPVAKVGDSTISERVMEQELAQVEKMYQNLDQFPPEYQLSFRAKAVQGVINYAVLHDLAKKYGVSLSDDDIMKQIQSEVENQIQQAKQTFIQQKRIKENATQAEFEAAFKEAIGKSTEDAKDDMLSEQRSKLGQPDTRLVLEALALSQPLIEAIKKTEKATDDEIKASYDELTFKSITFSKGDVDSTAEKAEKEIKGGLSFEAAIDRYSTDTSNDPKKKLHDITLPISRQNLNNSVPGMTQLGELAKLKPGEVSGPIKFGDRVRIYKLIDIKSKLPKDYDKKKSEIRDSYLTTLAAAKLQSEIAETEKKTKIEWKDDVYKAYYEYQRIDSDPIPPAEKSGKYMDLLTMVIKATAEGKANSGRLGNNFAYNLYSQLRGVNDPSQRAKLEEIKPDVLRNYLQDTENAALRMELVEIAYKKKDAKELSNELLSAANANLSQPNTAGQGVFNDINKYSKLGQDAKLLTADEVKQIDDIQRMWVDAKKEQDKYDAESKKQADEEAKKNAPPAAKSRDDFEKEKANAGSSKPKGK